jgi:hypothetical protein
MLATCFQQPGFIKGAVVSTVAYENDEQDTRVVYKVETAAGPVVGLPDAYPLPKQPLPPGDQLPKDIVEKFASTVYYDPLPLSHDDVSIQLHPSRVLFSQVWSWDGCGGRWFLGKERETHVRLMTEEGKEETTAIAPEEQAIRHWMIFDGTITQIQRNLLMRVLSAQ